VKLSALFLAIPFILFPAGPAVGAPFIVDRIPTSIGDLEITFVGHGTLMFAIGGKVIHVDPFGRLADYSKLPDADLILITHEHGDHLDLKAMGAVRKKSTVIIANSSAAARIEGAQQMENGQKRALMDLFIEAVPAYNVVHKRGTGEPFHPPGRDNGYVVTFGDTRVYIAGDTENIEDMKSLGPVDIAFIPANLPYTMTPEMAADAARMIRPKILYPYHYGDTEVNRIIELLSSEPEIEVRIRPMK
jgi:L-ascorbate metabolism protein UlaG (beta-lactamase superfamily)